MEKIYMNDYGEPEPPRKKRRKLGFSVVLSFVVALFGIASLVVVGFSNLSMAAPVLTAPFTNNSLTFKTAINPADNEEISIEGLPSAGAGFFVPIYLANGNTLVAPDTLPLLCVEHHVEIQDGANYTREDPINDPGLIYIFNKSGVLGSSTGIVKNATEVTGDANIENWYIELYATQVAIWVYLHETRYNPNPTPANEKYSLADYTASGATAEQNLERIENAVTYEVKTTTNTLATITTYPNLYEQKIRPVINDAERTNPPIVNLSINGDSAISKIDENTYQTSELSVSSTSNTVDKYKLSISGINGAVVVDTNGNPINDLANHEFNTADKFFIRIPVQSVPVGSTQTLTVHADATISGLIQGHYFVFAGKQTVALITGNQGLKDVERRLDVVRPPDTKLNKAQTIYFIGLIVLLCGVGIIYANAKQDEAES